MKSELEETFVIRLLSHNIPNHVRQYRFAPPRKWAFDFAWPEYKVAIEIEGGTWINGRHNRGKGFEMDCEKYNAATLLGWRVFRFTSTHLKTNYPILTLQSSLVIRVD
jgi:very-short-patch-repair endonuclease